MNTIFIWVDVSSKTLDIYNNQNKNCIQIQNNYKSICSYFKFILSINSKVTIFSEATWVYSSSLCKTSQDLWIIHYEINPRTIHQLGKNLWDRNKTAKIDAEKIANIWILLSQMNEEWMWKNRLSLIPSSDIKKLKSIMSAIHSLKYDIQKFKQRISAVEKDEFSPTWWKKDIEKSISVSLKQKEKLVKQAMNIINEHDYQSNIEHLCTIPWISKEVSLELIVFFMDLEAKWIELKDKSKVKACAWLDVSFQQSWSSINKKRISKQWNKHVRSILQIWWRCWFRLSKIDKYKETNLWKFFQRMEDKFSTPIKKNGNSICTAMSKKLLLVAWWIYWRNEPYNWS